MYIVVIFLLLLSLFQTLGNKVFKEGGDIMPYMCGHNLHNKIKNTYVIKIKMNKTIKK